MKIFCLWSSHLAFLFITSFTFAQESVPSENAVISVESKQSGMPVLIDGKDAGFTPLRNWPLPPGKHEIAVKRSRPESWLDVDWVETCSLAAGDTLSFVAEFRKGYSISSVPFGAEVYVNGVLQGTTPLVLRLPNEEPARVELRMTGYQSASLLVGKTAAGNAATRLYAVTLKPETNLPMMAEVEKSSRRFHLSRNRRLSLAAAGVSVVSGVAAILLKDKADHYYEQYLTTGMPEKREMFYKRTEDYDRYSGIATAVFEASFAVSFYFFLKSTAE